MKKCLSFVLSMLLIACLAVPALAAPVETYVVVTDFVEANSGTDVSAQLQQIIDEHPNRTIYFPDGEYLLSAPIYTPAEPTKSVSLELSDYAVLKAADNWTAGEAIVQLGGKDPANDTFTNGSNYSLEGGIIDGNGVANGISINGGRETAVRNTSIKHTVIGLHIMPGANSGSSDADIFGVNIIGTGNTDSVGIWIEGFDNTITNVRIGNVFVGVHLNSSGNMLRNVHPLYQSDYTDYQNSCGFLDDAGNNWYDYCYSDQFATGFCTTSWGRNIYNDCFCFWYSSQGDTHTAFRAEEKFNSTLTNFKTGFTSDCENIVLTVGESGGSGVIDNLIISGKTTKDVYAVYLEPEITMLHVYGLAGGLLVILAAAVVIVLIQKRHQNRKSKTQ